MHLRSVHAHLDFSKFRSQDTVINLQHHNPSSFIRTLDNSYDLASLPSSPAGTQSDFEMEDITLNNAAGDDGLHSNLRSSPLRDAQADNNEYHPVINGKYLININCTPD